MATDIDKTKVVKGTAWAFLERFNTQIITFVVGVVLARLLTPSDYGSVALLSIFTALASVLVEGGFGLALIQKKEVTELDYNSVFYCSLTVSTTLYLILFFAAPYIADFYGVQSLRIILRIQALQLILNSINSIQNVEISRGLKFNLSFKIGILSTLTYGIVGIGLAYFDYGVWALVWSSLASSSVNTIARWFIVKWRPSFMFSFSALKPLFAFSWKMILVNLLDRFYMNLYGLLIGKMYTKEDLAFVNKGQGQPSMVMNSIEGTLASVTLPTFSKFQGDRERMVNAMRKMIVCSSFFVFPLMTILGATAYGQVKLMYGDQWLPAVPYIQIACFQMALYPFHNMNLQAIAAWGRTDLNLKIEIIKKTISLIIVVVSIQFSVMTLMLSLAFISAPISVLINSWPNRKLFGYAIEDQIKDLSPSFFLCVIIGLAMYLESLLQIYYIFELILQCSTGFVLYIVLACLFRIRGIKEFSYILGDRLILKSPNFLRPAISNAIHYIQK